MQTVNDVAAVSTGPGIGTHLDGRYQLVELIGRGGMASVYRAMDVRLSRNVAVKVLDQKYAEDSRSVQRFRREAEFAAGLSAHPNIVSVYDVGSENGVQYLVMELVEGPNLKTLIEREAPFAAERAVHIAGEVAAALDFAHRHGCVHRDVKPQNILMGNDGTVKVADFGIARSVDASQLTEDGAFVGTATYLAPEQARGKQAQASTDVYGLGVVLFEMLTGVPPFTGDTSIVVAMQHVEREAPRASSLNPAVPDWLDSVVATALSKDPRHRYQTGGKMREALAHKGPQPGRTAPTSKARPVTPVRRAGKRWRPSLMPLIITAVALVSVVGAYAAYRGVSSLLTASTHASNQYTNGHHPSSTHKHKHPSPKPPNQTNGNQGPAIAGEVRLTYVQVDRTVAGPGDPITVTYTISNAAAQPVRIALGAELVSPSSTLTDATHVGVVSVQPGSATYQRVFDVPVSATAGTYGLTVTLNNPSMTSTYATIALPNVSAPSFDITIS